MEVFLKAGQKIYPPEDEERSLKRIKLEEYDGNYSQVDDILENMIKQGVFSDEYQDLFIKSKSSEESSDKNYMNSESDEIGEKEKKIEEKNKMEIEPNSLRLEQNKSNYKGIKEFNDDHFEFENICREIEKHQEDKIQLSSSEPKENQSLEGSFNFSQFSNQFMKNNLSLNPKPQNFNGYQNNNNGSMEPINGINSFKTENYSKNDFMKNMNGFMKPESISVSNPIKNNEFFQNLNLSKQDNNSFDLNNNH